MKKYLITSIGSMSVECVIKQLRKQHVFIVGCDIYPAEWHYESTLCDIVYKVPLAKQEDEYIAFIIEICKKNQIQYLIPSTDLEIDIIRKYRFQFKNLNVVLCMQSDYTLSIARNKYSLYKRFEKDNNVQMPKSFLAINDFNLSFPYIAKPCDGRSSEGLRIIKNEYDFSSLPKDNYIIQEIKNGTVVTVDYIRDAKSGKDATVPRRELLRTKNGAGLTVQIFNNTILEETVSYIGKALNVHGCINMEFIESDGKYYLIDINPRFSAGIAFSIFAGYDMVTNHIKCFDKEEIDLQIPYNEMIITKKYQEVIL